MIYISTKKSRNGAIKDALSHGLIANHTYSIIKFKGWGNYLVADSSEGEFAMNIYRVYGLRWFLLRGEVLNHPCKGVFGDEAIEKWRELTGENV